MTEHLVNPIEFQLMDKMERERNKKSREKKKTIDMMNRTTV